jgi:hypothetical protein
MNRTVEGATAQLARTRARSLTIGAGCVAAVAIVAWPVRSVEPAGGGDWSWVAMMSYAATHGLDYGNGIVWTYGPLGFLNTWFGPALYDADVLLLSWLFALLVQVLLAGAVLVALRRRLPVAAAVIVAVIVVAATRERVPALAFAWCVLAVTRGDDAPRDFAARAFPVVLGVLTGFALLDKLNQGVELMGMALAALVAVARPRDALAFAASLVAAVAVGWAVTGQPLDGAWPYVRNGLEMVSGYVNAMGTSDPAHRWSYTVAAVLAGLTLALAWVGAGDLSRRRRWALLGLCTVYVGLTYKEGFVRQDPGHLEVFFGGMVVPFAVLPARSPWRGWLEPLMLGGVVACLLAMASLSGTSELRRTLNPAANLTAMADQVRTLASPARRAAIAARVRAVADAGFGISPRLHALVGDRSTMMWPMLFGEAAYAYGFRMRPFPTLEPHNAYTPRLDRLGAEMLSSNRAPERILRMAIAVAPAADGVYSGFEAPLATLEILCRYRPLATEGVWQLLARGPDRCGTPRVLRSETATWGSPVAVPDPRLPDALVLARIEGAGPQGLERLKALLLRPNVRTIQLDTTVHRLIPATAADGLLLHAPRRADFREMFAIAPNPSSVTVSRVGGEPGGELHYTFVEVPIRPLAGADRR